MNQKNDPVIVITAAGGAVTFEELPPDIPMDAALDALRTALDCHKDGAIAELGYWDGDIVLTAAGRMVKKQRVKTAALDAEQNPAENNAPDDENGGGYNDRKRRDL